MMPALGTALTEVRDRLRDARINAETDPTDLDPLPGVLVIPSDLDFPRLDDSAVDMTIELLLVAAAVPPADALDQLGALLDDVRAAIPQVAAARPISITLTNHAAEPLPGLSIDLTVTITGD